MRLDPPEILTKIHSEPWHGARFRLSIERHFFFDNKPMEFREPVGIEAHIPEHTFQPRFVNQRAQLYRRKPTDPRRAKCELRNIFGEIQWSKIQPPLGGGTARVGRVPNLSGMILIVL